MTSSRLSALLGDLNPMLVLIIGVIIGLGITSAACSQDATTEGSPTVEATPTKDVFVAQTGRRRPTLTSQPDRDSRNDRERGSRSGDPRPRPTPTPTPQPEATSTPTPMPTPTPTPMPTPMPTPTPSPSLMEETPPELSLGDHDNLHGNHGDDHMFDRGTGVNAPMGNTLFGGP